VLNKRLLENRLSPTLIADPNRFDVHSAAELVADIKEGQRAFQATCTRT
jgi:hypothetical protein